MRDSSAVHGGAAEGVSVRDFVRANVYGGRLVKAAAAAFGILLSVWFLGWAIFYAWSTICAMLNFSWRQPMFDEYTMYPTFLQAPFPENVLQSGNGHRPVFPNLVILAEIKWLAANHILQLAGGLICAVLATLLATFSVWRERDLPRAARAAGVLLSVLGVLWLANGRMLLHSYESLHVYLLILSISAAGLCTYEASRRSSPLWLAGACAACAVAMFCFGSGVASFPAVILIGFALRLPLRWLMIPLAVLVLCLFLYVFALPCDQAVRGVLGFHPLKSVLIAADWLSSAWVYGLLGHATPPLDPSVTDGLLVTGLGPAVIASANTIQTLSGISWQSSARVLGILGIAAFLVRFAMLALNRGERPTRLQTLASMLCLFALASAAVVSIGRLGYFQQHPEQVFADRYLVWSNLFWTGLALLVLADTRNLRSRSLIAVALSAAAALPLALLPTQEVWASWGSIVYRSSQQIAAAARSGVFDGAIYPDGADASHADVLRSLEWLKKDHLAMFAEPSWELVGTPWQGTLEQSDRLTVEAHLSGTLHDADTGRPAARFEGVVSQGIAQMQRDGQLVVLDESNTIVGLAEFSFIRSERALRLDLPRKRGFDGYIRDYSANEIYRLVLLQPKAMRAFQLQQFVP